MVASHAMKRVKSPHAKSRLKTFEAESLMGHVSRWPCRFPRTSVKKTGECLEWKKVMGWKKHGKTKRLKSSPQSEFTLNMETAPYFVEVSCSFSS